MKWVKKNWTDPVWSKVFSGIILFILGTLGVFLLSLIKQIPIKDLYYRSIESYLCVSYFWITISAIILLSLLIPAVLLDVVKFQLKHLKFPANLNSKEFDLRDFLRGNWVLSFKHTSIVSSGTESIAIVDGNQYLISNSLAFVLTGIEFNEGIKEIRWTKMRYENYSKHSRETIRIIDNDTIEGVDDLGYIIKYSRAK